MKIQASLTLAFGLIHIVTIFLLMKETNLGLLAVVVSNSFYYCALYAIVLPVVVSKYLRSSLITLLKEYSMVIIYLCISIIVTINIHSMTDLTSFSSFLISVLGAVVIVFCIGVLILYSIKEEFKNLFLNFCKR